MIVIVLLSASATVPKETVELSTILGKDLIILHESHRNMVNLYCDQMEGDVNELIDDVYTPFIIHYVLSAELESYRNGENSIYGVIEEAGQTKGKEEGNAAFDGQYQNELNELSGLSKAEIDSVIPGTEDLRTYSVLVKVIEQASRDNITKAKLINDINELGEVAVKIAKKVPSLASLFI